LGSPHKVGNEIASGDGGNSGKSTPNGVSPSVAASPSKISTDSSMDTNIKTKTVVHSLLEACSSPHSEIRQAASHSLALIGRQYPLLVLQEWYSEYSRFRESPNTTPKRRPSSSSPPMHSLTEALMPLVTVLTKHNCLDPGDSSQRAVLGQILAVVVEEMIASDLRHDHYDTILVEIGRDYMDKVMDVLLVHFQPSSTGTPVNPAVIETLASLSYHHPHHCVPFLKAILSTLAHTMKSTKQADVVTKSVICKAICRFCDAILDYISNISEMPDPSVTVGHFHMEGDAIFDILYINWLPSTKESTVKLQVLECIAACTPFLSKDYVLEKGPASISALITLYKKLGPSANREVTGCVCQLIEVITKVSPIGLDNVLDQVLNAMFIQVCILPDYTKSNTVKNHFEAIRCFDLLMKFYPEKVVSGLIQKYENPDERHKIGALTIMKHLLNLPTKTLNYRLEEITKTIHNNLEETAPSVRKLMAQIILNLGHHGCITGETGKDFLDFLLKLSADDRKVTDNDPEPLTVTGDNVLQLLTNSVSGVDSVLWPYLLEFLLQEEFTLAVPALCKSLLVIANRKRIAEDSEYIVQFTNLQYCSSPVALLTRLIVLASNPLVNNRGVHIFKFLKAFSVNINSCVRELWESRFPLLLHYLDQHPTSVEYYQWHNWLLQLLADTLTAIGEDEWRRRLVISLVDQLRMYPNDSVEKKFAVQCVGVVLDQINMDQLISDNLSAIFVTATDSSNMEDACAKAYGLAAKKHLNLVMSKLETLHKSQVKKKSSSFFGIFNRNSDETYEKKLTCILYCVGEAAQNAEANELEKYADKIVVEFLGPSIASCQESEVIQAAVLTSISQVAISFKKVYEENSKFVMPQHDSLVNAIITVLQDNQVSLKSKQLALLALTNMIQLPPAISQSTRCIMLKASFNTLFNSFLEADSLKHEDYTMARELDNKLTSIGDSLHILIKELLRQDMEQSTIDEIFTMLETWLRLDQSLSRELSVTILRGALEVYSKNVRLGVGSPSNFTPGPYMIGAIVARCHDPALSVRKTALNCLQYVLRILGIYNGLAPETVEQSIEQLNALNERCNNIAINAGKLDQPAISDTLVGVLNERIQHHHVLTLLDSLGDALLDSQAPSVAGCIAVFEGIINARGSEIFQNIPGLASKLHFKMTVMCGDETSDYLPKVATNIKHLAIHNCRGVVTSLLRTELPFDRSCKLVWAQIAEDSKLSQDVFDILLEMGSEQPVRMLPTGQLMAEHISLASIAGFSTLMDTHKLESLCRQEFGKIFAHLVTMAAHFVSAKFESRKSETGSIITLSPFILALESLRSLFSSINCLVVAHEIKTDHTLGNIFNLRQIMTRVVKSLVIHAGHLVQVCVSALLPLCNGNAPDHIREISISVLADVAKEKGGGDRVLLTSVLTTLLRSVSDPQPKSRELALEGLIGIQHCTMSDIDTLAENVMNAFITGIEDEKSSDVSLTALRGLALVIVHLPKGVVENSIDLVSLKVRPYLEMSSNEHRAAAVQLYGRLSKFAQEPSFKTQYLDLCQTVIGPILLYSNCDHSATRSACLEALETIANLSGQPELADYLTKYKVNKGFEQLMEKAVMGEALLSMLESCLGQCLGYFRSSNPCLRRNAVILACKVVCRDVNMDAGEEMFSSVLGGTLDLLKDPDLEVRKTAALYLGDLITLQAKQADN